MNIRQIFVIAFLVLGVCVWLDSGKYSARAQPSEPVELFEDNFDGTENLEDLGYVLGGSGGVTERPYITNERSASVTNSVYFPVSSINMRKKFDNSGIKNVVFEWNAHVPPSGSFAANLMQGGTNVVRTILFSGNWYYYNEAGTRVLLAPYQANEWMTLRIEMTGDRFNAYMNDTLVGEDIPTLASQSVVNTIYYSVGSKTAYVDDIRMAMVPEEPAEPVERLVTTPTELDAAIAASLPGDTIIMQDGTWSNINIVFRGIGTEERPITLKAQTAGNVIISGESSLKLSGEYLIVDGLHFKNGKSSGGLHLIEFRYAGQPAYHSRITNIAVTEFNKERGPGMQDVWVGLFGSHNRVDHSLFQGKTSESVLMIVWRSTADPNYHRIDHNHFKDIPSIGLGGATAIRIGDGTHALSSSYTIVESNIFENMMGIGKIINIKSGGNTIRNNTFIDASGSICIRQGNGNLIEGNYILPGLDPRYTGGILVIGEDHIIRNNYIQGTRQSGKAAIVLYEGEPNNYPGKGGYYPTKNITIANNTLVDNDKNILIGQYYDPATEMTVPVENITFTENAIVGNTSTTPVIEILDEPIGDVLYEGNQFYNGNLTGLENIPGISIQDPLLTLGPDGLYHYAATSALKDNILAAPLTISEVGPSWFEEE
ncbi:polysaccharide lyase 6 family protein [Paenibacillus sp. GYB003]|uniref:polysaccharide lyase 6 family protein n=1 Tax=Paenibacillus sp. GYB003 TaxID=2994392 RepID=UPI002F96D524